jgi:MoaA/NifB/PqqE/SkfB family radical SAM enzyme
MRRDVITIGQYARARGMRTVLCTTGTLIHEENVRAIMNSFDAFELPVDSLNPEIHDRLRGKKGMFAQTTRALDLLLAHRQPWHGIELTTVVRDENYREVGEINRRFAPLRIVTAMQPLHQSLYGATTKDCFHWVSGYEDAWDQMVEEYQWYDGFSRLALKGFFQQIPRFVQSPDRLRNTYTCFAGSYSFFVDPYGYVYLCDAVRQPAGNIRQKDLRDIWPSLIGHRQAVSSNDRQCDCWLLCTTPPSLFLTRFTKWYTHLARWTQRTADVAEASRGTASHE